MRINKYVALASGLSRRAADVAIANGRVKVNANLAEAGQAITGHDEVLLDGKRLKVTDQKLTIMLNKPVGYVVSRDGQGGRTIYDLLPPQLHHLKPVGRLDKNSSGLLLLTNDGDLANRLTHPSFEKKKVYEVEINKPLGAKDFRTITDKGVDIGDERLSQFQLEAINQNPNKQLRKIYSTDSVLWRATLAEGRNRQIRRSFEALGYKVTKLRRIRFSEYALEGLPLGKYKEL